MLWREALSNPLESAHYLRRDADLFTILSGIVAISMTPTIAYTPADIVETILISVVYLGATMLPYLFHGSLLSKLFGKGLSLFGQPPPVPKTGLKNVAAFISRCRLVICLDSAAIHLAGAVGTPVVALYGPKWPQLTRPFRDNIEIIWDESFDCRPCEYGHCKNIGHSCMDAISADSVIQKTDKILTER